MGDPFDPNLAAGDGQPYDWYYQGITLDYGERVHGRPQKTRTMWITLAATSPISYLMAPTTRQLVTALRMVFGPPNSDSFNQNAVGDLRLSFINSQGASTSASIELDVASPGSYGVVRLWIKNTGSSLYWHLRIRGRRREFRILEPRGPL